MKILSIVLIVLGISTQSALACRVPPIDPEVKLTMLRSKFVNLIAAAAGISSGEMDYTESAINGGYIWTNGMCPEGEWVSAEYSFSFEYSSGSEITQKCWGKARVENRVAQAVSREPSPRPAENSYKVDFIEGITCNK